MLNEWNGFNDGVWTKEINVRNFIQKNYTLYEGDDSFLAGVSEKTEKVWNKCEELLSEETKKGGVLDVETNIISGITVSSLLAVGIIFGDYVLVRNIAGTSFKNVQVYLFLEMKHSSTKASAVFVIIMITTFLITLLVLHLQKRDSAKRSRKVKE